MFYDKKQFSCSCGCGLNKPAQSLIDKLDTLASFYGRAIKINSGCRCARHNSKIGGVMGSAHCPDIHGETHAVDIACSNSHDRFLLLQAGLDAGFVRVELKGTWLHFDDDQTKPQEVAFYE